MKSLLLACTVLSLFAGCRSNGKSTKDSTSPETAAHFADSIQNAPVPDGTKRVIVETQGADGSRTITTTTTPVPTPVEEPKKEAPVASTPKKSPETVSVPAPAPTVAEKKKGWSDRAKGAAIGGAGGAATGAIISKNKVGGAIIGGAIGAGGGYIIGNELERKKKKP